MDDETGRPEPHAAEAPPWADEGNGELSGRTVVLGLFGALLAALVLGAAAGGGMAGLLVATGLLGDLVLISVGAVVLMALMPRNRVARPATSVRPWIVSFVRAALGLLIAAAWGIGAVTVGSVILGLVAGATVVLVALHIANLGAQKVWLDGGMIRARSLWGQVAVPFSEVAEMGLEPAPGWAMAFTAHTHDGQHHRIRLASFEENTLSPLVEQVGFVQDVAHGQSGAFRWVRPT